MKPQNTTKDDDQFNLLIKSKLEGHTLPVDEKNWAEIEKRIRKKDKRRIAWWMWLPVGSAAVIALLLSLGQGGENFPSNTRLQPVAKTSVQRNQPTSLIANHRSKVLVKIADQQLATSKKNENNSAEAVKPLTQPTHPSVEAADPTVIQVIDKNERNNEILVQHSTQPTQNSQLQQKDSVTPELLPNQAKKENLALKLTEDWQKPQPEKSRKNWLLAASVGSSGSAMLQSNGSYFSVDKGNDLLSNVATTYYQIKSLNDFSEKNYNAPLSFAVTARKAISERLSLESGLMYTYLLSTFRNPVQRNEADLHLHYIGIPVNLITRLWSKSKWEFYLSTGMAVEKGVQSVYVQKQDMGNSSYITTAKEKIKGLQWSVNGSLGLNYQISKGIGVYAEPRFSYFFDNDQPVSARTDKAVSVGLAAGIRVGL